MEKKKGRGWKTEGCTTPSHLHGLFRGCDYYAQELDRQIGMMIALIHHYSLFIIHYSLFILIHSSFAFISFSLLTFLASCCVTATATATLPLPVQLCSLFLFISYFPTLPPVPNNSDRKRCAKSKEQVSTPAFSGQLLRGLRLSNLDLASLGSICRSSNI